MITRATAALLASLVERWINSVTFFYDDGVSQTVRSRTPCRSGA